MGQPSLVAVVRSLCRSAFARLAFLAVFALAGFAACRRAEEPRSSAGPLPGAIAKAGDADGGATGSVLYDDEVPTGRLVAFKDDADLAAFSARWREEEEARQEGRPRQFWKMPGQPDGGAMDFAPAAEPKAQDVSPRRAPRPAPAPSAAPARAEASANKSATKPAGASESITNNQHADVDEGDIVKLHGDHLIVLRRGRLFTISLAGDKPKKSAMLDAFGPEIDPRGSWYDEIVVEGDHVVVVGFSYQRGGTEIGLFKIDRAGDLTYRATYHLRSNDYYSARNYASRIVDGRLVFYAPLYVSAHERDLAARFPAFRRWSKGVTDADFVRTLATPRLYHLEGEVPSTGSAALHTVTTCDLREPALSCESTGVLGPPGRVFYVSPSHVYVWMQEWSRGLDGDRPRPTGLLAKLPIGRARSSVTAVRVAGMPTDQFSFEEDDTGHLDVLVRAQSNGDAMFLSEATSGATALLRVPQELFSERVTLASSRRYRVVPSPDGYSLQNRFVGSWLLYGSGQGYVAQHHATGRLYAVRYASQDPVAAIELDQGVDRIEPMGDDAVVVGSRNTDLVFTPIELGAEAHARRDYVRKNASQGELRSHGFFYKPSGSPRDGVVGLPIRTEGARGRSYLLEGSASVLFLSHRSLELTELGALAAAPLATNHDGCRASCVDWYGNARPIFAKDRVFALMGYEIVEGRIDGKPRRITERARLSFAPRGGPPASEWDD